MRTVMLGDVVALACVLRAMPKCDHASLLASFLDRAHSAHKVHKRLGRPHCDWGNGSLLSLAERQPQHPAPFCGDVAFMDALRAVIDAILHWKARPT